MSISGSLRLEVSVSILAHEENSQLFYYILFTWLENHTLTLLCTNDIPFLDVNGLWFQSHMPWRASILKEKMQAYYSNKGHPSSIGASLLFVSLQICHLREI